MKLNLHKCDVKLKQGPFNIVLATRLPYFIKKNCNLEYFYTVSKCRGYYLLEVEALGEVFVECSRCANTFDYAYSNTSCIAVCSSEDVASNLMAEYEPLVAKDNTVDIADILTDDLYLFCPDKHADPDDCAVD